MEQVRSRASRRQQDPSPEQAWCWRQVGPDRLIAAAASPERTLAAVRSTFYAAEGVELLGTRLGARPMPADGEPIVGPVAEVPGLYLAVMHSAVTYAAAVGRLVARELAGGT